jgi:hypothetical protein
MRSRLFFALGAMLLASASCAQGSPFVGAGGGGGGDTSTGSSSFLAVSSSTSAASGSGSCSQSPCKLASPQCGCGAGQECTLLSDMPACQPAGTTGEGQLCMGQGSCAPGLLCVGSGANGVCNLFCDTDADCAGQGGICAITLSNGTANGSIPNATLCSSKCNPATNSGCAQGTGCQPGQEPTGQMRFLTYCDATGQGGRHATCASSSDCKAGYGCLNNGNSNVCVQWCDMSDFSACGGAGCQALQTPILVDGVTYGVCG